jgi:hypothetical protein
LKKIAVIVFSTTLLFTFYLVNWHTPVSAKAPDQTIPDQRPDLLDSSLDKQKKWHRQIEAWIKELAMEQGFEQWENAEWEQEPIGPGIHGWHISIRKNGEEIGYMIVNFTPDGGLQLGEYGTGANPLFSLETLYQSLMQQELILDDSVEFEKERIYLNPFYAFWRVTIPGMEQAVYLDAATGEMYPLEDDHIKMASEQFAERFITKGQSAAGYSPGNANADYSVQPPFHVLNHIVLPSFDPYERLNFVNGTPMEAERFEQLSSALIAKDQITYAASLFDDLILVPVPVIGYMQMSDGRPYLIVDQEGPRYIPFTSFKSCGDFFAYSKKSGSNRLL